MFILYLLTDMLKSGYYTSRQEIFDWINLVLHTEVNKIEQLGSGCIFCHLLDAAYPEKVPLHKVKWSAYLQIDFIYNFKLLQNSFDHLGINKNIDVQKLAKAKCQDNLEFIQWMKWQFSGQINGNKRYIPEARRNYAEINLSFAKTITHSKSSANIYHHNQCNKENIYNNYNQETPRMSLKSPRDSLSYSGACTQRNSSTSFEGTLKRKASFFKLVSDDKKEQPLMTERPKIKSNRMHTEFAPLVLCHNINAFILEADEQECF